MEEEEDDDEGEQREAQRWLKPSHKQNEGDSTHDSRRGGGVGGRGGRERSGGRGLKLEVAIPTFSGGRTGGRGGETEGNESATYSSDFTKDSIEGWLHCILACSCIYVCSCFSVASSTVSSMERDSSAQRYGSQGDEFQDTFSAGTG